MLYTRFGLLQYILRQNHFVWSNLSEQEKQEIFAINILHNTQRDEYADPTLYGKGRLEGGEIWDSEKNRLDLLRGKIINSVLETYKPQTILELGPGSGFYTKLLCEKEYVKEYIGVDINSAFLEYLEPRLKSVSEARDFSFRLLEADFNTLQFENYFDCILIISTVHHIPNRLELFKKLATFLKPGGVVLCIDPSHAIPRIVELLKKCLFDGYLKQSFLENKKNWSTHHMCSYGEYSRIAKQLGFRIDKEWYILPKKKYVTGHSPLRFLSREIAITLKKEAL